MQIRPSRPLSVIGAMKDIQQYKIMKAQADLAPTLAEKTKTMWDWQKKDRAKDVRIKDLALEKAERNESEEKRKLLVEMKTGFAQVASDVMEMNLSQEETTEYLNLAYQSMKDMGSEYADELEDKDGNNIIDMAEIKKEDLPKYHAAFYKQIEKLAKPGDMPITKKFGEDWVRGEQIPVKPTKDKSWKSTDKTGQEWISTLNADGTVTTKKIEGITGKPAPDKSAGTGAERERAALIARIPQFQAEAKADPNKLYDQKAIRLDENANVTLDAHGAPKELPEFEAVAGKRGMPKALFIVGEHYDDTMELKQLLADPKVSNDLKAAENANLWDRVTGTWSNRIKTWMAKNGILEDSPTATAVRRMGMMASETRKEFLGVAITETELKTVLSWMVDPADSYSAMVNKINLIASEGKQHFQRFLDVYKNKASMAPYYKAWGLKRFHKQDDGTWSESEPSDVAAENLIKKYTSQ